MSTTPNPDPDRSAALARCGALSIERIALLDANKASKRKRLALYELCEKKQRAESKRPVETDMDGYAIETEYLPCWKQYDHETGELDGEPCEHCQASFSLRGDETLMARRAGAILRSIRAIAKRGGLLP